MIAEPLELPWAALTDYAAREQPLTDPAREIGAALGLRPPVQADLSMMIEAAASVAWPRMRDNRLHITPVKLSTPPEADALADRIDALLPLIPVTELLHEIARDTGFLGAFSNLRAGEPCPNENARLAAMLADPSNLGLARMAAASQGVTRDGWVWTADAFIRNDT